MWIVNKVPLYEWNGEIEYEEDRTCSKCGYKTQEEFKYCPMCGENGTDEERESAV